MPNNQSSYQKYGDIGNGLLVACTSVITACLVQKWPGREYFDNNWLSNGFCVSNPSTFWWNSHMLSFYVSTIFAAIISHRASHRALNARKCTPPVQWDLLSGAAVGVFFHGAAHFYIGSSPVPMDMRFKFDNLAHSVAISLILIVAFAAIFKGIVLFASKKRLFTSAAIATIGVTVFDVEPELNVVYGQAALYITSALNMLSLSKSNKDCAAYMLYPFFQFPILLIGILESTGCESFLQYLGGHMFYDASIAMNVIMLDLLSTSLEKSSRKNVSHRKEGAFHKTE